MASLNRKALATFMVVMAAFIFAGTASANSTRSAYGQCGPQVHNGAQLLNAWGGMNVLNTASAKKIATQAGWSATDGQMTTFIIQRGREFQLAKPAYVTDYGCKVGQMYSVGVRHYGAGERVIAIVPKQFAPSQVSSTPRAGYTRKMVSVKTVGRGSCANGFSATVKVWIYVKHSKTQSHNHQPAKKKPPVKATPAACVTTAGAPLYAPLPSGVSVVNGVCTSVTTITTQSCKEGQSVSHDSNGNMICINIVNNNINTVTVPVTVVVTPPATPPCNCSTPPAPPVPPTKPPVTAPSVTITSFIKLNLIAVGKTSGPAPFSVNASQAGGSVTVDPGLGGVSDCNSSTPQASITFQLAAGNNNECVIFYAPNDADQPAANTVTYTAIVGSAKDVKTDTFAIQYPTRP